MSPSLFSQSLIVLLISFAISFILAPVAIWFSNTIHLVDVPGSLPHHTHTRTTPLSGGLVLVAAFLVVATIFNLWKVPGVMIVFLAGIVVFGFGVWDDLKGLNARMKFLGQIAATTILVIGGIRVRFLESPQIYLGGAFAFYVVLDVVVTYLWVVGITNAFNLIDSMDGIAVGLAISALLSYAIGAAMSDQLEITTLCVVLIGIAGVLFMFNSSPARLFLGDSGAQTLGFVLAVISIVFSPKGQFQASSWFLPILILGVPIFDTFLVIYSRLKNKKPVFNASLDHVYHRLTRVGFSSNRTVTIINATAILLDCVAFVALTQNPPAANLIFAACLLLGGAGILLLSNDRLIKKGNQWLTHRFHEQEINDER